MCGFAGFLSITNNSSREDSFAVLAQMGDVITHRGPDDSGVWLDLGAGVGLVHRRLSILDLSPAGHQPMRSPCGRYTLVYNGEIYNHLDLRVSLEAEGGHFNWRGHSDTETLLAALRHWGVEGALRRVNGMFAFALWDGMEHTLYLARDRIGEKPLYYGSNGGVFLFGSELKSLVVHPRWHGEVDREALTLFMRYNYVPSPWSIYRGIAKLPPAHYVVIQGAGAKISEPVCYWDLAALAGSGIAASGNSGDSQTLTDELDELLRDAVGRRMAADVPLGAFLSGGYDSTTVTALMQAQSNRPVKTFSIGFHEKGYNEAKHAKAVAEHLGTDHTELYVSSEEAMGVIPKLPSIYDEPFADSSQIPTYLVSQLARRHVTVSLSGDGGDELFAGYNRHIVGPAIWGKVARLPRGVRHWLGSGIGLLAMADVNRAVRYLPSQIRIPHLVNKLEKLAGALKAADSGAFYKDLVSHWKDPATVVRNGTEPITFLDRMNDLSNFPGLRERIMYMDMMTYLPDDILSKVDRASMAVSLEARVPLLDHRVVEFAWAVPTEYKYRDGQSKWLLRQVLYRYVPKTLMDRPKMGFGVPIEHWLRGPLRDWAEDLLNEARLQQEGYFNHVLIRQKWKEHLSGQRNWQNHLWCVLMFQAWLAEQREPD